MIDKTIVSWYDPIIKLGRLMDILLFFVVLFFALNAMGVGDPNMTHRTLLYILFATPVAIILHNEFCFRPLVSQKEKQAMKEGLMWLQVLPCSWVERVYFLGPFSYIGGLIAQKQYKDKYL